VYNFKNVLYAVIKQHDPVTINFSMINQEIGHYKIIAKLGEGGMATIFKGIDTRLDRVVAVKFIKTSQLSTDKALKRFELEAKALAKLSHPNIVKILDYGEHQGSPFLVMEYISGGTLKDKLGEVHNWQEAAKILYPIADALAHAHKHKIVHRDIKPANILFNAQDIPMLSDFGIAKILELDETLDLTGTNIGIGTPAYMSPEQGLGQTVDARADIYSLGVVLYEILTGQKPYQADTPMGIIMHSLNAPTPRPSKSAANIPKHIDALTLKAMAKKPEDRFQHMGDFAATLEQTAQGKKTDIPIPIQTSRWLFITGGVIGISVLAWGFLSLLPGSQTSSMNEPNTTDIFQAATIIAKATQDIENTNIPKTATRTIQSSYTQTLLASNQEGGSQSSPTSAHTPLPTPSSTPNPTTTPTLAPTKTPTFEPTVTSTVISIPACNNIYQRWTSPVDEMELSCIPEGEYSMGFGGEAHKVHTDAFWMDRTEITNAMYRLCVSAGICTPPQNTSLLEIENYFTDETYNDYPVVEVTWEQANLYCAWAQRRLPSEAEWEKSARGGHGAYYPWGHGDEDNAPLAVNQYLANFCDINCTFSIKGMDDGYKYTAPVGSYPNGVSDYGVYDLAGNVYEWVNDIYSGTYFQSSPYQNPPGPDTGSEKIYRGGSFNSGPHTGDLSLLSTTRNSTAPESHNPDLGFRCAVSSSNP
jgi:serine/threonine protein kinase